MSKNSVAAAAKLMADMAAKYGQTLDVEAIKNEAQSEAMIKEERAQRLQQADGVLRSLHYPHQLMMRKCTRCNLPFQTNYCYVSMCSMTCRKLYFQEKYGIKWEFTDKPTFGEYEPPTVVSADAALQLYKWATAFISDYDRIRSQSQSEEAAPILPVAQSSTVPEDDDESLDGMSQDQPEDQESPSEPDYVAPPASSEDYQEQDSEGFEFDF